MGFLAALPWIISGTTGVASGLIARSAAGSAAKTQAAGAERAAEIEAGASREAVDLQREIFNRNVLLNHPRLQAGTQFLNPCARSE